MINFICFFITDIRIPSSLLHTTDFSNKFSENCFGNLFNFFHTQERYLKRPNRLICLKENLK